VSHRAKPSRVNAPTVAARGLGALFAVVRDALDSFVWYT
jgi:hypothetical protein